MNKQFLLSACCIVSLVMLQACSDSSSESQSWHEPSVVFESAKVQASVLGNNDAGDIVIVWQEVETQERTDQELTDAHNPEIPYNEDDPVSPDRDMNREDPNVFEPYDSSNLQHREEAKQIDYGDHEAHTHINIYSRTNILSRVYDAGTGNWGTSTSLQTGFWALTQKANRLNDPENNELTITDNLGIPLNANISVAANAAGDALIVWIQIEEDADNAGDAAESYEIYTARFTAVSESWSSVEKITRTAGQQLVLKDLTVALESNGNAKLLWLARDTNSDTAVKLYTSSYNSGSGSWSNANILSDSVASSKAAKIRMLNDTSGVAFWLQLNTSGKSSYIEQANEGDLCQTTPTICDTQQFNLYSQQFDATGWLATPIRVSDGLGEIQGFDVAGSGSSVWAVFEQKDLMMTQLSDPSGFNTYIYPVSLADNSKVMASKLDVSANTWSTPAVIQLLGIDESYANVTESQLAVDSNGNVMVVWTEETVYASSDEQNSKWNNSIRFDIWSNVYNAANGNWSGPQLVVADERYSADFPRVLSTVAGKFSVAWTRWSTVHKADSGHKLFSVDYDMSTAKFGTVSSVANDVEEIENVYLLRDQSNHIKVLWQGQDHIYQSSKK